MSDEETNKTENDRISEKTIKKGKNKSKLVETIETIFIAFILAIFIRATVAEARYIPSESMVPTLLIKDRLVIEKISNYTSIPKRGQIIVFYPPFGKLNNDSFLDKTLKWLSFSKTDPLIKRVIGLPGETIEINHGTVFIDGKPLEENDYINEKTNYKMPPQKIPEDSLFMMGDNRNNSMDSHVWGTLPVKNIVGHAIFRFWPPQRIGTIN